jgi:hypothetical protein
VLLKSSPGALLTICRLFLAAAVTAETGWLLPWVVGGLSILIASLISPIVGRAIQDYGGRPVLAFSSILLDTGLVGIGLSQNIIIYLSAWIVIGLGMSAGLYDAAFATLGRIYQALGTLLGPSQMLARALEMIIGRRFHPIWTMVASTALVAVGLTFLLLRLPVIAVGLVLYGAGAGIMSIARGTVPLALFGAPGYAVLMAVWLRRACSHRRFRRRRERQFWNPRRNRSPSRSLWRCVG